jgi:hypothetical protein
MGHGAISGCYDIALELTADSGVPWQSPRMCMNVGHPGVGVCMVGVISRRQFWAPYGWMMNVE